MNKQDIKSFLALIMAVSVMCGCNRSQKAPEETVRIKVPVKVTGVQIKDMTDYIELNTISRFLNKSVVSVPATGYIADVFFNAGDNVRKGQELFTLRTKEAEALQNDSLSKLQFPGLIHVKSAIDGMIITINHPKGDFVPEGEPWGTISVPSSLVFLLDAPYESTPYIRINGDCEILLPDGNTVKAKIGSRLPSMSEGTQTQQFIIKPQTGKDIPENLIAKIRIAKKIIPAAVTLPRNCILSDEVMKHFWVMKLINDTTAVRVDIVPGLAEGNMVQITDPVFTPGELFLSSGNYGLADTVMVKVEGR